MRGSRACAKLRVLDARQYVRDGDTPCAVDVSAAQGYENTFDRESTADYDRGGNAGDLIVSAFQEAHDVECNRQPPVDGEPALALRSRRLRLAGRGQGRDCRRRRLASRVEPRPPHSPQGGK